MAKAAPARSALADVEGKPRSLLRLRLRALWGSLGLARIGATGRWNAHKAAGKKAFRDGNYVEAERQFVAALKHIDPLGTGNTRAAATLNNLALVYKRQRKYGKAEICLRRALRIYETATPGHVHVANVLTNLAGLYHAQGKNAEAQPLRRRARTIIDGGIGQVVRSPS